MEKPKIYAAGNEDISGEFNISYYVIEKDDTFLDWLGKMLVDVLGIETGTKEATFIAKEEEDDEGSVIKRDIYKKNITKMIDVHEHYGIAGNRVDVFYGESRIFLTLRKSREVRKKFAQFIIQTKDWIDVKEVKEIPDYLTKKD